MKETWVCFKPQPRGDELWTMWEKLNAIKKCLKKLLPGCNRIIRHIYYEGEIKPWGAHPGSALIIVINRIGGLSALLYDEQKDVGRYELVVDKGYDKEKDRTPVTSYQLDHKSRSEIVTIYKIPPHLDIKKYLNKRGG